MDTGEILSKSFKYPFNDFYNFKFIILFFTLLMIPTILFLFDISPLIDVLFYILLFVLFLIFPGYLASVVGKGVERELEVPRLNIKANFINTIKIAVLSVIYYFIPFIFIFFMIPALVETPATSFNIALFLILFVVMVIVFFIFNIFLTIAFARMVHYDSLNKGLEFKEIYRDIKKIGVGKTAGWYIVVNIIYSVIINLGYILVFIPVIGIIIFGALIIPFTSLFYSYSIGLIYSNVIFEDN